VYLGKSTIHGAGKGIFAARPFLPHEYVCFYDGEDRTGTLSHEYGMMHAEEPMTRIGFQQPVSRDGVGQLANDGACLDFVMDRLTGYVYTTQELRSTYEVDTASRANIVFKDSEFNLMAQKAISAHEELFLSYGTSYWISMNMKEANQAETRVRIPEKPFRAIADVCLSGSRATLYKKWYTLPSGVGTRLVCAFGCLQDLSFFLPTLKDEKGVVYSVPVPLAELVRDFIRAFGVAVRHHNMRKADFFPMELEISNQSFHAVNPRSVRKIDRLYAMLR
jgi:hypothetical protein